MITAVVFVPIDDAKSVHTFLIDNIGTMVTDKAIISNNPTESSPHRVIVQNSDNRFFNGRILFTVIDDVDGTEVLVPRIVIQVFDGVDYVTSIEIDGIDDGNKTSDLPLTGFDPQGNNEGKETFRIFLAADDGIGNARDTTATIRYSFTAHTQK